MPVKQKYEIEKVDGLIIPGGESTTMMRLITKFNLEEVLKKELKMVFLSMEPAQG